jgi:hypothetical protein
MCGFSAEGRNSTISVYNQKAHLRGSVGKIKKGFVLTMVTLAYLEQLPLCCLSPTYFFSGMSISWWVLKTGSWVIFADTKKKAVHRI